MESMDEIIDLDELQEGTIDETLKEFISKDEDVAELLKKKLDELSLEEEKLSNKEDEVKKLEESNREKISSNASADELIEIAGKLKDAEKELQEITENIKTLETEKEELINTKKDIEKSKQEYIKTLESTNSNYEEQLKRISEAIEVCSNPALKQVLNDVKQEKEKELTSLQEKRNDQLKVVLNEYDNSEENNEDSKIMVSQQDDSKESNENVILPTVESYEEPEKNDIPLTNNVVLPTIESDEVNIESPKEEVVLDNENIDNNENNIEEKNESSVIDIDSILSKLESENKDINFNSDLNVINTDDLVVPDVNISDLNNESKVKIIFEKNVPTDVVKDIYSSSKVMPVIYDFLDNKDSKEAY